MGEPTDTKREPYEPPMVEDVPLAPEERLLAACKTSAADLGSNCPPDPCTGTLPPCMTAGS